MVKKIYTRRECVSIINNNGYVYDHSSGSHDIYKKGDKTLSIPSTRVNPMLFRRLLKEHNMKEVL